MIWRILVLYELELIDPHPLIRVLRAINLFPSL
jgi:hypothetical protein